MIQTHKAFTIVFFILLSLASQGQKKDSVRNKLDPALQKKKSERTEYALPQAEPEDDVKLPLSKNIHAKKAELFYNDKAFAEAIPHFQKALATDSLNEDWLTKLGDCYRLTNDLNGQIACYGAMIRNSLAKPIHELYYAQALMSNGEDDAAKPYFEKYGADPRGKNLASSFGKKQSFTRNSDAYRVDLAGFNSSYNDMCAVKFYNATVFSSSRPKSKWIAKKQGWTNSDYLNIFATKKDAKGADTKPVQFMKDLDTRFNDGPLCFNKDFYMVYYTTNFAREEEKSRDGNFKLRILEGELDEGGLSIVKQPAFINKEYNYCHPALSADGKTLFFASDMEGGLGGMDIYRSEKDSLGEWGPAVNLGEKVNTAGTEVFPFVSSSGALFFASNGHPGMGGLDIYEVKFKNKNVVRIYNMGDPINSRFDDFGYYLAEDGKSGYLSSNRKNGGMDDDIYEVQVLREIRRGKDVLIVTKDKSNGNPLPSTRLLVDKDTVFTNEKGEFMALLDEEGMMKIKTLREDCFELKDTISARTSTNEAFVKEFLLEPNPKLFLHGLITDAKTGQPLPGVNLRITDINTGNDVDIYTTTETGDYFKFLFNNRIGDKLAYLIKMDKKGYLPRSVIFTHQINKGGEVNMNEIASLQLGKVEVGMDLGKLIDLQPIYFDVGKSDIRPDAALELDKIIEVMNQYPNMFIELGSHTDCRSTAESNLALSTARAKSSVDYIVKKGINKIRIVAKGYGESRPLNNCFCEGKQQSDCSEEEHAKNRRTEFLITRLN